MVRIASCGLILLAVAAVTVLTSSVGEQEEQYSWPTGTPAPFAGGFVDEVFLTTKPNIFNDEDDYDDFPPPFSSVEASSFTPSSLPNEAHPNAPFEFHFVYPPLVVNDTALSLENITFTNGTKLPEWLRVEFASLNVVSNISGLAPGCLDVLGDVAFVGNGSSILVVDIYNRGSPAIASTLPTQGYAYKVVARGHLAFVLSGSHTIHVIDASNPWNATIIANLTVDLRNEVHDICLSETFLFIANDVAGLVVYDVTDIFNITKVANITNLPFSSYTVYAHQGVAYVGTAPQGLYDPSQLVRVNVSDFAHVKIMDRFQVASVPSVKAVKDSLIYVSLHGFQHAVQILNISSKTNMTIVAEHIPSAIKVNPDFQSDMSVLGNQISTTGIEILEFNLLSSPPLSVLGTVALPLAFATRIVATPAFVYVVTEGSFSIFVKTVRLYGTAPSEETQLDLLYSFRSSDDVLFQVTGELVVSSKVGTQIASFPNLVVAADRLVLAMQSAASVWGDHDLYLDSVSRMGAPMLPRWLKVEEVAVQPVAQLNFQTDPSGGVPSSQKLVMKDFTLYLLRDGIIYVCDASNSTTNITLLAELPLPSVADFAVDNGLLYVVSNSPFGLTVYSLQNITSPVPLGDFPLSNSPIIQVEGRYAFLGSQGLLILDVLKPDSIVQINLLAQDHHVTAFLYADNQIFMGTADALIAYNAADLKNVQSGVSTNVSITRIGVLDGGFLYTTGRPTSDDEYDSLMLFEASNITHLQPIRNISLPYDASDMTINGGYLFIPTSGSLLIYDVRKPAYAHRVSTTFVGGPQSVQIRDGRVFIASQYALFEGLIGFEYAMQAKVEESRITTLMLHFRRLNHTIYSAPQNIIVNTAPRVRMTIPDQVAFINQTFTLPLDTYSLFQDPDEDMLTLYFPPIASWLSLGASFVLKGQINNVDQISLLEVAGHRVYVVINNHFLVVYDVEDMTDIKELCLVDASSVITDVKAVHNTTYILTAQAGLRVYDVQKHNATLLGSYNITGGKLIVENDLAYIAAQQVGLVVLNVVNSTAMQLVGQYVCQSAQDSLNMAKFGSYVLMSNANFALIVFDVSNPTSIQLLSSYPYYQFALLAATGDRAYAVVDQKLLIFDMTYPRKPYVMGSYTLASDAKSLQVAGNLVLIGEMSPGGVSVYDASNPNNIVKIGSIQLDMDGAFLRVRGRYIYAADASGIQIFRLEFWSLSGTPTSADIGNKRIDLTATDPLGLTAVNSFNLVVQGPPSVQEQIPDQVATVGKTYIMSISQGTIVDPNGDIVTLNATIGTAKDWLTFNTYGGTFQGVPRAQDVGDHEIVILAWDRMISPPTPLPFKIRVINAPVAHHIPSHVVQERKSAVFNLSTSYWTSDPVSVLDISAVVFSNYPLPSWLTFDNSTLSFVYTPPALTNVSIAGQYIVTVTAQDQFGNSASREFVLTVNAGPKAVSSIDQQVVHPGEQFSKNIPRDTFYDPNTGLLKMNVTAANGGPREAWLHFDETTSTLWGQPSDSDVGHHLLRVWAEDHHGARAVVNMTIVVERTREQEFERVWHIARNIWFAFMAFSAIPVGWVFVMERMRSSRIQQARAHFDTKDKKKIWNREHRPCTPIPPVGAAARVARADDENKAIDPEVANAAHAIPLTWEDLQLHAQRLETEVSVYPSAGDTTRLDSALNDCINGTLAFYSSDTNRPRSIFALRPYIRLSHELVERVSQLALNLDETPDENLEKKDQADRLEKCLHVLEVCTRTMYLVGVWQDKPMVKEDKDKMIQRLEKVAISDQHKRLNSRLAMILGALAGIPHSMPKRLTTAWCVDRVKLLLRVLLPIQSWSSAWFFYKYYLPSSWYPTYVLQEEVARGESAQKVQTHVGVLVKPCSSATTYLEAWGYLLINLRDANLEAPKMRDALRKYPQLQDLEKDDQHNPDDHDATPLCLPERCFSCCREHQHDYESMPSNV